MSWGIRIYSLERLKVEGDIPEKWKPLLWLSVNSEIFANFPQIFAWFLKCICTGQAQQRWTVGWWKELSMDFGSHPHAHHTKNLGISKKKKKNNLGISTETLESSHLKNEDLILKLWVWVFHVLSPNSGKRSGCWKGRRAGVGVTGWWALRGALERMSTGCCSVCWQIEHQ